MYRRRQDQNLRLSQLSLCAHTASLATLDTSMSCSGAVSWPQQLPCCPRYLYHLRYRRSPCTSTSPKYNVYMYTNISVHINMLMYMQTSCLLVHFTTCTTRTLVYLYIVQHVHLSTCTLYNMYTCLLVHCTTCTTCTIVYLYIVQHVQSPCSALYNYCVYNFLGCGHQIHPHLGRAVISLT